MCSPVKGVRRKSVRIAVRGLLSAEVLCVSGAKWDRLIAGIYMAKSSETRKKFARCCALRGKAGRVGVRFCAGSVCVRKSSCGIVCALMGGGKFGHDGSGRCRRQHFDTTGLTDAEIDVLRVLQIFCAACVGADESVDSKVHRWRPRGKPC